MVGTGEIKYPGRTKTRLVLQVGGYGSGPALHYVEKKIMATIPDQKPRKQKHNKRRQKLRKRTMIFGTWNIQGLNNKMKEVHSEIKRIKGDIICLTETKKKGHGVQTIEDHELIWSGVNKEKRARAGVAIIIKRSLARDIKDIIYVNERILHVSLQMKGQKLEIIAVYAPTNDQHDRTKEEFYADLAEVMDKINPTHQIFIMGDLNGRVGSRENDEVVGKFGEKEVNDNGERLIGFCKQYELKIGNSFYEHKEIHKITWERPSMNQKSILDYIIFKQNTSLIIQDVRVKRGFNCGSDHYLVIGKILFAIFNKERNDKNIDHDPEKIDKWTKFKLHLLHQESIKLLYQNRLKKHLESINTTNDVEEFHQDIQNAISKAALEALGEDKINNNKNRWWDFSMEEIVMEKKNAYLKWLNDRSPDNLEEYKMKKKIVKQKIKEEQNRRWENMCLEIETMTGGTQASEVWKCLKSMKTNFKQGRLNSITMNEWISHYEKLLIENRYNLDEDTINFPGMQETDENIVYIDSLDVEIAVSSMRNHRSPGPGGIPAELIKYGGRSLMDIIAQLMNKCIISNKIPLLWKTSYITSVFKKGSKRDPSNYRGISINCSMSRLFSRILKSKLEQVTKNKMSEEQNGFTQGRSCMDGVFIVQQIVEKRISKGLETYMAFIDLEKAYDSIPRHLLWEVLINMQVDNWLIKIIHEFYRNNQTYIKVGNYLSQPIHTTKGLRQGCSLSPLLFNIYLEEALLQWKRSCRPMGIPIGEDFLFTLNFADDQVIFAQDVDDLEFMLRKLYTQYRKFGMEINVNKTQFLVTNSKDQYEIFVTEDESIKQVEKFKYLGTIVTNEGIGIADIQSRIEQARRVLGSLNSIWWDKNISRSTKLHIGKTLVESVLCYNSDIWVINAEYKRKLLSVEMDYLRRSEGVSRLQRIRNEEIRRRMNAEESVIDRIDRRKLKWFGHLVRMQQHRWPRKIFQWTPKGKGTRGRPRKPWYQQIKEVILSKGLQEQDALDRERWRSGTGRRLQLQNP